MKILFSGIQPSGDVTLGNYIGSILNIKNHQKKYQNFISIVDLHALTTPKKTNLTKATKQLAKILIACGLNTKNTTLFLQSNVLAHSQLAHILLCHSSVDELKNMIQYKDKVQKLTLNKNNTKTIPAGLLTYPTLMAADILLYQASVVPVGSDQTQHLELTKNLVKKMNKKYNLLLQTPLALFNGQFSRIMSLSNPLKKMSKSDFDPKGTILLLEDLTKVEKKIMSAVTDSENKVKYDPINKPGVSNLIAILASLKNLTIKNIEKQLQNSNYHELKIQVSNQVVNHLKQIQTKYHQISDQEVTKILEKGAKIANDQALKNLLQIQQKMGFFYE